MRLEFENQLQPVWYAIEKIGEWARQSGSGQHFGVVSVEEIRKSLQNLKLEISKTGRNPETDPPGIAHLFPDLYYVLDQLEQYMQGRRADISSQSAAHVFYDWLYFTMKELRTMARELDEEQD